MIVNWILFQIKKEINQMSWTQVGPIIFFYIIYQGLSFIYPNDIKLIDHFLTALKLTVL